MLLVGPGQLGRVLAGGLVARGVAVDPVRRGEPIDPGPEHDLVLVAVGERDLDHVLSALPASHRDRVVLLQNELLPPNWQKHGIQEPTVLVVWFEKKRGRPAQIVRTTEIAGPSAPLFVAALDAMDLPAETIGHEALVEALVVKNLYIVGANVLGLVFGGTTGALATTHRDRTEMVLREIAAIERARLGSAASLDDDAIVARTFEAFEADPTHATVGRTAQERLGRALDRARALGVETPELEDIAAEIALKARG